MLLLVIIKIEERVSSRCFYKHFRARMGLSTRDCQTYLLNEIWVKSFGARVEFVSRDHRLDFTAANKLQTHRGTTVLDGVTLHKYGPTVDWPYQSPMSHAGASNEDDASESGAEAEAEAAAAEAGPAQPEADVEAAAAAAAALTAVGGISEVTERAWVGNGHVWQRIWRVCHACWCIE
jgi:hypothetical protein